MKRHHYWYSDEARALRCSLLTPWYDRWRKKYPFATLAFPQGFPDAAPLSVDEAKAIAESAPDWAHNCLDFGFKKCGHRVRASYESKRRKTNGHAAKASLVGVADLAEAGDDVDSEVNIEFDPKSQETTVTIWSYFANVTQETAETILIAADPPNWERAAPIFFFRTQPGEWHATESLFDKNPKFDAPEASGRPDPRAEPVARRGNPDFERDRKSARKALEKADKYALWEHVTWEVSPQMSGGIINILEIENELKKANKKTNTKANGNEGMDKNPVAWANDVLDDIVKQTDGDDVEVAKRKAAEVRKKLPTDSNTYGPPPLHKWYSYKLLHCKQSKILSAWEEGGLDVDEGYYRAAWMPAKGAKTGRGPLIIQAQKKVHYSRRADVIPGTANVLNLLAPAVTTMLLSRLAFTGILDALRNPKPKLEF